MDRSRYNALMEVIRSRMTVRAFDPSCSVPREHYEMILEAARHSPRPLTEAQIDEWVASTRHKVMYRDQKNVD